LLIFISDDIKQKTGKIEQEAKRQDVKNNKKQKTENKKYIIK